MEESGTRDTADLENDESILKPVPVAMVTVIAGIEVEMEDLNALISLLGAFLIKVWNINMNGALSALVFCL
jgi:hypothetical protein